MAARSRRRWLARLLARWARALEGEARPQAAERGAGEQPTVAPLHGGPPAHWLEDVRRARPDLVPGRDGLSPGAQVSTGGSRTPISSPLPLQPPRPPQRGENRGAGVRARATAAPPLAPALSPPLSQHQDHPRRFVQSESEAKVEAPSPLRPSRSSPEEEGWGRGIRAKRPQGAEASEAPSRNHNSSRRARTLEREAKVEPPLPLGLPRPADGGEGRGEGLRAQSRETAPLTPSLSPPRGVRRTEDAAALEALSGSHNHPRLASAAENEATIEPPLPLRLPRTPEGKEDRGERFRAQSREAPPLTPSLSPPRGERGTVGIGVEEAFSRHQDQPRPADTSASEGRFEPSLPFSGGDVPTTAPLPAWPSASPDPWPALPTAPAAEAVNLRLEARRLEHRRRLEHEQRGLPWSA